MLARLALYGGRVTSETNGSVRCRCRCGHAFTYTPDSWCSICMHPNTWLALKRGINQGLDDMESGLTVLDIDMYGICDVVCNRDHHSKWDMDEIPNLCDMCADNTVGAHAKHLVFDYNDTVKEYSSEREIDYSDDNPCDNDSFTPMDFEFPDFTESISKIGLAAAPYKRLSEYRPDNLFY